MKKTKKFLKFSLSMIMVALIMVSSLMPVKAITAPNSLIIDNYEAGYANNPLKINRSFQVKQASDGKYVYCMAYNLLVPKNTKYINKGVTNDAGVSYIISQGANDKTLNEYFVTQVALWIYLLDKNLMQDSSAGSIKAYRSTVYSSSYDNNGLAKQIRQLVSDAKSAKKTQEPTLSISNMVAITKDANNYVTSTIYVNTTASDYQISLENAPSGATYEKVNKGFIVKIPTSSVKDSKVSFKAVVTATGQKTEAYIYNATDSSYQPVVTPYTKEVNLKDDVTLTITPTPEETPTPEPTPEKPVISIIKRDKDTNEALEGATLILTDDKGNVIDEWVTTKEAHVIENLDNGTYTLKEKSAPDGYELTEEEMTFEVTDETGNKTITFYNEKIEEVPETPEEIIEVPVESTGMNKSAVGIVFGIAAIASGIAIIYRKAKTNK